MGQITQQQSNSFLNDSAVTTGHAGISIYEPATGKYLYMLIRIAKYSRAGHHDSRDAAAGGPGAGAGVNHDRGNSRSCGG